MARRSNSVFEEISEMTSKVPWWIGIVLSAVSFLFLHWYAGKELPGVTETDGLNENILPALLHSLAFVGQLVVPAVFLCGTLVSVAVNSKKKSLYDRICRSSILNPFDDISWQDFKYLVSEYFRRRQFSVEKTESKAAGDVDLLASKDGKKYLIQCMHCITEKVGVTAIGELLEVMVSTGATYGIVATSGLFTKDAIAFARANNIVLLNGRELLHNMKSNMEFQNPQGSKHQKMVLGFAGFLVVILCCSVFFSSKMGAPLRATILTQILNFLPDNQEHHNSKSDTPNVLNNQTEKTDHTFTQEHIRTAMEEVLSDKKHIKTSQQYKQDNKETMQEGVDEHYLYEIELISGSWIRTDNITITKDKVRYEDGNGIVVSINKDEIKTLKRSKSDG